MRRSILLLIALTAGCAGYHPSPLEPAHTAEQFQARSLDDPGLARFLAAHLREAASRPPQRWDLPALTLAALYYHPDLDLARAGWGVAKAEEITAGQRPNPSFGFIPQYDTNPAANTSPWTLGFTFDIPIETAGKRDLRAARAQSLSEAARLELADTAWKVRSRLAGRFFDCYGEAETAAQLGRQEKAQEELVRLLEARVLAGEAPRPEATRTRLSLTRTRMRLSEAQGKLAEARALLASAIGVPLAAVEGITLSFDGIEALPALPSPQELRRLALTNRPDLLALLARYRGAEAALRLEIAKQYPDLRLGPGYQWDQGENKWSFGFSVTLPVFDRNRGGVAEAQARRTEAAAAFLQLQARVIGEVERAQAKYLALRGKLAEADLLLALQKERQRSVRARFDAGAADRTELAAAAAELEEIALARLDAFSALLQARKELEDALGRPLPPEGPLPAAVETPPRAEKEEGR